MRRKLPDKELVAKIERNLVVGFAGTLAVFWVIGEQAFRSEIGATSVLKTPSVGGMQALMAIVFIILLNAWFVAAETAISLVRNLHVRQLKDLESVRSLHLQNLIDSRQKYIAACALGSQTSRLALALFSFLLAPGLASLLEQTAHWEFSYLSLFASAGIIALVVALVNMVVGEVVPKSFAALHPHRVAVASYRFIRITSVIFSVPANVVVSLAGVFTARFGGQASLANSNQAEEEIKNLVESAEETGEIEQDEKKLLHSVFSFTDKVAREAMTPRVDMDALPVSSEPKALVQLIEKSGHSRIPLYEGTDDQIVGIVHAKDLLMAVIENRDAVDVHKLIRPALFVPENKDLHELLKEMRNGRIQMAIVQDEFGGTAGIVTVEDIVEELVGDITDEYDNESAEIERVENGYLILGKTHMGDINVEIGSTFSSEEFDTIGGYVFGLFGRQPKLLESITFEGWKFSVAETDGRRIRRIGLEKIAEAEPIGEEED